ncbi:hypothetical protein Tco_0086336 [Tanacetum coccineum]
MSRDEPQRAIGSLLGRHSPTEPKQSMLVGSYQYLVTLDTDRHRETHHNAHQKAITGCCLVAAVELQRTEEETTTVATNSTVGLAAIEQEMTRGKGLIVCVVYVHIGPHACGGYGSGYGGPKGGHSKSGVVRPSVVCKEKGPCYKKKLTCPAKCFTAYSGSGKGYGGGGGGGGCAMDCKKCVTSCVKTI